MRPTFWPMKLSYSLTVLGVSFATVCCVSNPKNAQAAKIDFVKEVKPILEVNCVACHSKEHAFENGEFSLTTKADALKGGDHENDLVPGNSEKSLMYKYLVVEPDSKKLMPPKDKGGPLAKDQIDIIKKWIDEGAEWPADVTLKTAAKTVKVDPKAREKEMALITEIHKKIVAKAKEKSAADMKQYSDNVTTNVTFEMLPIPAGEFTMGSPASEAKRKADEGPQHKVKLDAFWMGKCEVTWNEYEQFMYPDQTIIKTDTTYLSSAADATARPTKPYVEMSFGMGKDGYPAISMTQHSANKYCEWLSAKTGHFYRLPTEAEWEYACRAGTTTAYSFGDDESKLGEYAWFEDNAPDKYQKVGKKKPNPWGLHDMHGNVAEWCLDGYDPDAYKQFGNGLAVNPWIVGVKPYPHVARGGGWIEYSTPDKLRSAARIFSDPSWKQQDPQLPKSIWFLTDAQFLGFRVVRPLKVPTPEEMYKYWNNGVERE